MKKNINLNKEDNIIDIIKIDDLESKDSNPEKYKLQCMLPDYVFNKLSPKEQAEFEQAVVNFPDLEEEVKDAKDLFSHIEKFDYKKMIYDKSQYLPDRVVENLKKRNALYTSWQPRWKRLIATGIFAALILIYFKFAVKDTHQVISPPQPTFATEFFSDTEKEIIADIYNFDLEDIIDISYNLQEVLSNAYTDFQTFDFQALDDYYISTINSAFIETIQSGSSILFYPDNDYMYLFESIEEIDEIYFQELLNQISNL